MDSEQATRDEGIGDLFASVYELCAKSGRS
jgi:hypothetical protein